MQVFLDESLKQYSQAQDILTYIFMYTYIAAFFLWWDWDDTLPKRRNIASVLFVGFIFQEAAQTVHSFQEVASSENYSATVGRCVTSDPSDKGPVFCSQFSVLIKQPHVFSKTN